MSSVRELHDQAARLAQLSMVARHQGELEQAKDLARQAYGYESRAAELVADDKSSEPTRSILYLSAASLAYQCKEFQAAQRLIAKGLSGYPPPQVEEDLKDLYEQVKFEYNLQARGVTLGDEELRLSMEGKIVGPGIVLYDEFKKKIENTLDIVNRTVERKMGREYRTGAGRPSKKDRPFIPLVAPVPGSFSITLKLALAEGQMPLFFTAAQIIDEILNGIKLLNNRDEEGLRDLIEDEKYRRGFVSSVRDMAPDGDKISFVGFASKSRTVSLTRQRSDIELMPEIEAAEGDVERKLIEVTGLLDFATIREQEIIGLTDKDENRYAVVVQEGMEDVVRSYFAQYVIVTGLYDGKKIYLTDIQSSEE